MIEQTTEKTGEKFHLPTFLKARELCISVTEEIIAQVRAGFSEVDGQALIKQTFAKHGALKFWHPSKFRIASDTTKSFRELPDPSLRCAAGDLCFVDVGPIFENHEADYGRTFVIEDVKSNPLIEASHDVFMQTAQAWKAKGLKGTQLLHFAQNLAQKYGYELNPAMAGHRLGDFPHQLFSKQKLFEWGQTPSENLWVLEIHLLDPKNNRGAFFEDILV